MRGNNSRKSSINSMYFTHTHTHTHNILLRVPQFFVLVQQQQSHILLFVTPWTVALPGFPIHGIFQARILEWVVISYPGDLPDTGIEPTSPALEADSLPLSHQGSPPQFLAIYLNNCNSVYREFGIKVESVDYIFMRP